MAGSFSNYYETRVLQHVFGFGQSNLTPATPIFLALSKAAPGEDGSGLSEPSTASGYSRKQVNSGDFTSVVGGSFTNTSAIEFSQASDPWGGTITHVAFYNAVTSGTMLAWGSLDTAKTIGDNDTPRFAANDLKVRLD